MRRLSGRPVHADAALIDQCLYTAAADFWKLRGEKAVETLARIVLGDEILGLGLRVVRFGIFKGHSRELLHIGENRRSRGCGGLGGAGAASVA